MKRPSDRKLGLSFIIVQSGEYYLITEVCSTAFEKKETTNVTLIEAFEKSL